MANTKDLQWALHQMQSRNLNPQTISFFLSQPTSCCRQQTETSLNLNLTKDNLVQFSQFLNMLGSDTNGDNSSVQNLEFHLVEWELQQMQDLTTLLENNPTIKQLIFKRNKFDLQCLSQLADSLRRNKSIKELILSESGISSYGAETLASSLKVNDTLEELQIWEDSIGSNGAEELSKMIEVNSTLKLLTIFDSKSSTATPLISAVLARNRSMEVHIWSKDHNAKISKIVEFVPENSTLRVYNIDVSSACRVACSLGWNSTVASLDMTGVKLNARWAKEFRSILEQNRTLREVNLSKTTLKDKGAVYIAAGLFKNHKLDKLCLHGNSFGGVGVEHLLCPLSKFSTLQNQANTTLKSLTLGGGRTKIGKDGLAAIVQMLTSNQTITYFGIYDDRSLKPDDIVKLFKSLEKNATLKCLSLQGCKGVKGELVHQSILETLNVNPWIEDIDLARTPLGNTEGIYQRLGQNEKTEQEQETDLLKDMAMTVPKSCRVFLCGQECSGKSTLSNSISQNISPSKLPYLDQVRIMVRTPGLKIKTLKDEDIKISIWNLGNQHEFYSLHDFMFPGHGSSSFFLIVSSLLKRPNEIEQDLENWLRFIVSNLRKAVQQCMLPNVAIVLTHYDKVNNLQDTVSLIERIRGKFEGYIELYPTVFTVDARSSASVSKLSHHIRKISRTILERVPRVYQLCNDLADILSDSNKPVMKWKEFSEVCQVKIPYLRVRSRRDNQEKIDMRRRAVATSLHHIGEVIYFDEMGFLILDCEWFCCQVLNQVIRLDVKRQSSTEFIRRKELEKILIGMGSNVESFDLIKMMIKLELCYEQDPSDPDSPVLIPFSLEDGRWKTQRWPVNSLENNYVGRRLECDDSIHMFLTAGFFPRLQVHLHNKVMGLKNQHGASYSLEKYLILININGIHVRVELAGELGCSIDVLACSTKNVSEMLRLFQHLIVPAIRSLIGHGITLSEYVIRSNCVKHLTPPRYRRNQSVHLQKLKQALLSVPADSIYDYQHTWDSVTDILEPGFDFARDLLSDNEFRDVLHSRYNDLYNLAMELEVNQETNSDPDRPSGSITVDPTVAGIAKGVEAVLQRLKIIEQEIKDVKQEIQGLRYYEHRLLIELHRKVNYLVNYNIQVEERKVPNMFYFVRTENYSRRLITNIISGMQALRMHMLCEFRREIHVVEDQMGCELMQVNNVTVKCLAPYMTKFMTLVTFALKIGAHLAVGMGGMIPDLGREVAHLMESPMVYGAAGAAAAGAAGAAMARNRNRSSRDVEQDLKAAQQWVVDFLREQGCSSGKDIAEKFGLFRVRYRDDGQIAWICRRHMHGRAYEIMEAPI